MYLITTPSTFIHHVNFHEDSEQILKTPLMDRPRHNYRRITREQSVDINKSTNLGVSYIKKHTPKFIDNLFHVDRRDNARLPDLFLKVYGYHFVSKRFKEIIEKIDPGTHLFWKINLQENNDVIDDYFLMQSGRLVNFEGFSEGITDFNLVDIFNNNVKEGRFDKDFLESMPMFSIKGVYDYLFISDDFKEEIFKKGLYIFPRPGLSKKTNPGNSIRKII